MGSQPSLDAELAKKGADNAGSANQQPINYQTCFTSGDMKKRVPCLQSDLYVIGDALQRGGEGFLWLYLFLACYTVRRQFQRSLGVADGGNCMECLCACFCHQAAAAE